MLISTGQLNEVAWFPTLNFLSVQYDLLLGFFASAAFLSKRLLLLGCKYVGNWIKLFVVARHISISLPGLPYQYVCLAFSPGHKRC